MSSFSDYAEAAVLDHLFGLATMTSPTLYLAASTANPTDDASGLAEPSGNGYARVATASSDWQRSSNVVDNVNEKAFPEATGTWGNITHLALFDAASGGNMIAHAALDTARSIAANETLRFPAGSITFTLD